VCVQTLSFLHLFAVSSDARLALSQTSSQPKENQNQETGSEKIGQTAD